MRILLLTLLLVHTTDCQFDLGGLLGGGAGPGGGNPNAGGGGLGDLLGGVLGGNQQGPGRGGAGLDLNNLMSNPALQGLMQNVQETINGISKAFFAPQPSENGIPPHVLRRAMRFCSKHPNNPKCR